MNPLSILLADDQNLFARSLQQVLESDRHLVAMVTIAPSGEEAVAMYKTLQPDLVLLDVSMPGIGGVEALRAIRRRDPEAIVVMLTAFGYDEYVHAALASGARGYVLKDIAPEDLLNVIRTAVSGGVVLSPEVTGGALDAGGHAGNGTKAAVHARREWVQNLTEKEQDLLRLVAKGYGNTEIGHTLHLGPQTVRNYISALYAKIGAKDRFEAIRLAIEAGFGQDAQSTNVTANRVYP